MAITPLYDKVVIRPLISDQTTSGGIVIPGTADNSDRGVVVAVGEGHILRDGSIRPLRVKVGDTVITSMTTATVEVDGEELKVCLEVDLIGIIS